MATGNRYSQRMTGVLVDDPQMEEPCWEGNRGPKLEAEAPGCRGCRNREQEKNDGKGESHVPGQYVFAPSIRRISAFGSKVNVASSRVESARAG